MGHKKCLPGIRWTPHSNCQWIKVLSRNKRPYKMSQFKLQPYCQNSFFFSMTLLHAHTKNIFILCDHYLINPQKALVKVDFPMFALFPHVCKFALFPHVCTISPCMHYLKTKSRFQKQSVKQWLCSKTYHFVKNIVFGTKLLHAHVQRVCVLFTKYQIVPV